MRYHTYTACLSTSSSLRCLLTYVGRSNLKGGFPLRCFQRLFYPNVATRQCGWRHNRYTIGSSTLVLSY